MMKRTTRTALLLLALLMFVGLNCFAAIKVQVNAVGSTGMFQTMALGAYSSSSCGTNMWSKKSGASGVDSRRGDIPLQTANIWIVWDNAKTKVCAYLGTDSIIGQQLFFAVPRATLSIPSSEIGSSGDNLIPTVTDVPLDVDVYNALNNLTFNAAPTDVRPEDAFFQAQRVIAPLDPVNYNGLGYTGDGQVGTTILSAFSSKSVTPVAYAISGKDPISGGTVKAFTTTPVGADPIVVFVNTQDTAAGGFGTSSFNNVSRFQLTAALNGTFTRTRDLSNVPGLPSIGMQVILREPMSGTYTTAEFNIPRDFEIHSTQELNVDPNQPGGNPLNIVYASGGSRRRGMGTGEVVAEVGSIPDAIGYSFWSTGNFAKVLTTTKYLSVDGVDPLNYSWYQTHGTIPNCVIPCKGLVPFVNILNGSYPAWTILRVVTDVPVPAGVAALIKAAQTSAINVSPDFVPVKNLQVFRSHFPQAGFAPSNGNPGEPTESGGDVGGAVYTVQGDKDYFNDTALQIVGQKQ
ncbi:MAG: hypothetical protein LAO09_15240 [Acidobacteriia bacterium]|nr:hypothetical protein [Terriglobia bacterium]